MTDHIEFLEAEFSFRQGTSTFRVRTEVGEGFARVVVEESQPEPVDEEPSE